MIDDKQQRALACRVLLATVGLERLWTRSGPTDEAFTLLAVGLPPLAANERVMLLATWAIWNGSGSITLAEIIDHLGSEALDVLCFLLMASKYGPEAVDDWLADHGRRVTAA